MNFVLQDGLKPMKTEAKCYDFNAKCPVQVYVFEYFSYLKIFLKLLFYSKFMHLFYIMTVVSLSPLLPVPLFPSPLLPLPPQSTPPLLLFRKRQTFHG